MTRKAVEVHGVPLDLTQIGDRARLAELKAACIRLRNFGATVDTIADKLGMSLDDAESVLEQGLRDLTIEDAQSVRGRQQAMIHDIYRAMYPALANGDQGAAGVVMKAMDHEGKLHGVAAPTRIRVGVDREELTTRVEEDVRALGLHPRMDVPLSEGDDDWANT